jgi:hypothetical protein
LFICYQSFAFGLSMPWPVQGGSSITGNDMNLMIQCLLVCYGSVHALQDDSSNHKMSKRFLALNAPAMLLLSTALGIKP